MWTGDHEVARLGREALSYRGAVWRAMGGLRKLTDQVHPALSALRLGELWGAVPRPWFLLCKAGGRSVCRWRELRVYESTDRRAWQLVGHRSLFSRPPYGWV